MSSTAARDREAGVPDWIARYWGKAQPRDAVGQQWHPLAYHQLDVAACASVLLALRPSWLHALVRALGSGATAPGARALALRLAAGHDAGKWGAFQAVAPEAILTLIGSSPGSGPGASGDWRHDNVGLGLMLGDDEEWPEVPPLLWDMLGDLPDEEAVARLLASPAACHHGRPTAGDIRVRSSVPSQPEADARAFAGACAALFPDEPSLPAGEAFARRASLVLAALVNVADWLGSDEGTFPYEPPLHDLAAYWEIALCRAGKAVHRAGLRAPSPPAGVSFAALYPAIGNPSPLQTCADVLPLPEGPFLVVVEETTGGGKTEAAMVLAARMIASGHASGVFLGLPTTVTADQQASRQALIRRALFADDTVPTMTVAHSGAGAGLLGGGAADLGAWLADDRRRRLLADVCVGTIDQALLAALPAKYSAVRIAGLIGKVLVVDEAHAYDAYTRTLLRQLLALHGALGGSAILLSATLPRDVKADLVKSYSVAAELPPVGEEALEQAAYPLVTVHSGSGTEIHRPDPAPNAPADRPLRFVRSIAEAEDEVLEAAEQGACVAWVRNTVDQAIEAARALQGRWHDVMLLHSRFAEVDRDAITASVLRRFGPASIGEERRGGIVVATAVIEQSLDLDFDMMVVDLKPVEGVVQALGRARRHRRDAQGNRVVGPDARPPQAMVVVAPDPTGAVHADWYSALMDRAAFVHPDPACLWRTARVLEQAGTVAYAGMRAMVDDVHGSEDAPEALWAARNRALGDRAAEAGQAQRFREDWGPDVGYVHRTRAWDDEKVPTRLGDTVEVVFVVGRDGTVGPYVARSWADGRMRLRASQAARLPQADPDDPRIAAPLRACPNARVVVVAAAGNGDLSTTGCRLTREYGLEWVAAGPGASSDVD